MLESEGLFVYVFRKHTFTDSFLPLRLLCCLSFPSIYRPFPSGRSTSSAVLLVFILLLPIQENPTSEQVDIRSLLRRLKIPNSSFCVNSFIAHDQTDCLNMSSYFKIDCISGVAQVLKYYMQDITVIP